MSPFLAELLGTMLLILMGGGVVANVCLAVWKVIGYARKSRDKKIKRKPFEMSIVSVFCQIEKMQMTT